MKLRLTVWLVASGLVFGANGCGAKRQEVTERQRKEAAHLVSEADFAMTLRDWARAEGVLAKAVELAPDTGQYWVSLGSTRMRLSNRAGARAAYQGALQAFQDEAKANESDLEPWMQQVYVLALLGRRDDARALLQKVARRFPESRSLRSFVEGKKFDAMLADPEFTKMAL
jgi:Flp pilus assembly protein TadD